MASFSANITAWALKTMLSADVVIQKLTLDAITGIQNRSPVDEGRFRASHRISVNKVDSSVEPKDFSGPAPDLTSESLAVRFGDTVHITNSLAYAKPLEDGSSKQTNNAPDGIYGATFAELTANLDKAITAARRS